MNNVLIDQSVIPWSIQRHIQNDNKTTNCKAKYFHSPLLHFGLMISGRYCMCKEQWENE